MYRVANRDNLLWLLYTRRDHKMINSLIVMGLPDNADTGAIIEMAIFIVRTALY